jgi:hypothetical protein
VWLSLPQLRELPLEPESRCRLLQALALAGRQARGPLASPLQLQLEAAEATASSGLDALDQGAWLAAVERQNELLALITALAQQRPDLADQLWSRYGELLAGLTAAVHGVVNSNSPEPPEPELRAELCWRLMELLEQGRGLPFEPPDWLAVLEQQLVQDGARFWQEQMATGRSAAAPSRALTLLLRLSQLLEPCPAWVVDGCRSLMEAWLLPQLEAGSDAHAPLGPTAMASLLGWLERWPVGAAQRPELEAALLRLRLGLELLDQMGLRHAATSAPAPPPAATPPAAAAPPTAAPEGPLQLVLQRDASSPAACLNLAPLLTADLQELEAALARFVAGQDASREALPAASSLLASLLPLWQSGGRLPAGSFALLSYAAAAWQRRLGERLQPLPPLRWESGLLVELDRVELALLQAVLGRDPAVEPALATLRRQHHDGGFWQEADSTPWYGQLSSLEALRRLQRDAGFYASGHAPLESLRLWAQGAVAALLSAQVWSDDASCLGPWLALAQLLVAGGSSPAPLTRRPEPAQLLPALAGLEVVYVGEGAEAMEGLHRRGELFRPEPFGLRCLTPPASRHPQRPHGSFEQSLEACVQQLEQLYQQRPFQVLLCDAGSYRLGLAQALHTRLGVRGLATATPLPDWLAGH